MHKNMTSVSSPTLEFWALFLAETYLNVLYFSLTTIKIGWIVFPKIDGPKYKDTFILFLAVLLPK